jgi:hypothetical protein
MTTRTKIAITVAAALALAITNYGQAMSVTDFGLPAAVLSIGFLPRPVWRAGKHTWQRLHGR